MARTGEKKILVPSGVTVTLDNGACRVKGPKGEQTVPLYPGISVAISESATGGKEIALTSSSSEDPRVRAMHGTLRNEIANAVVGVTEMFQKVLEINGVGYRVAASGKNLTFNLGYSSPVLFELPPGIEASIDKQTVLSLKGCSKYLVGQVAYKIRALRAPEPYKGKGIKYQGEQILRKEGKAGKKDKK